MRTSVGASAVLAVIVWALPASGQSIYVAGAIGAEVVRTSSTESGGAAFDNGSGEALAGALRVGTVITPHFGVELEFFRPGEIETDNGGLVPLASRISWTSGVGAVPGSVVSNISDLSLPSFIDQSTRMRTTTTSALAFVRQPIGSRFELVYLGGVGFSRVVREMDIEFRRPTLPLPGLFIPPSYSTRTTQYAAGPVVGAEMRAGMTGHLQLVAGLRMHTLGQSVVDGWMIRPNVGLAWKF